MDFGKPVAWIGLTPELAVQLAENLIRRAIELGFRAPVSIEIGRSKPEPKP